MQERVERYDVVVVGGGPGGVEAAKTAAMQGQRVALINAGELMGYGLEGAYKSKSMWEIARAHYAVRHRWSVMACSTTDLDLGAMRSANREGAEGLRRVHRTQLERLGVRIIQGYGRFADPHHIEVEGVRVRGERIVLATGTSPRRLPFAQPDGHRILTSDDIVELDHLPESILILGAGVIGCEFASIFASLGSKVVLIDSKERIFSHDDPDLSELLTSSLRSMGVEVWGKARCASMRVRADGMVETDLGCGEPVVTERALLAIGRVANTGELNLEATGVTLDKYGFVTVCDSMRSSVPHIYAVGDVGMRDTQHDLALVHVARAEGRAAVEHMAGVGEEVQTDYVPFIIFTLPMIAGAGMSECEARKVYGDGVRVGKFAQVRNHRAHAMRATDGFVKLIVAPEGDDRILGVRAIGDGVDAVIGEVAVMIQHRLPYTHLLRTVHAHPSLSESLEGAARIIQGCAPCYLPFEEFVELGHFRIKPGSEAAQDDEVGAAQAQ